MTLNGTGAVGMLGVGVVGAVFLGYIQDRSVASNLQATKPEIYAAVSESKESVFGKYEAVNIEKVKELPAARPGRSAQRRSRGQEERLANRGHFSLHHAGVLPGHAGLLQEHRRLQGRRTGRPRRSGRQIHRRPRRPGRRLSARERRRRRLIETAM